MIRLSLRLTATGGREALTRLAVIAAAVTIGVGMLLATLAGMNAENAQSGRYAWLQSGSHWATGQTSSGTADPVWWAGHEDVYAGHLIGRIEVAATGPRAPVPPGLPRLPGPGEYYASPAMAALLASAPADQLADRYPGHLVGTIGQAGVPDPTALLIVVGRTPDQISQVPDATKITSYATRVEGTRSAALEMILGVVATALLFPVLIFTGTATRLSAARREQRFAAMRLVGATPRQISAFAAMESTLAALVGTATGFVVFFAFRRPLAAIPFSDAPFYPGDLTLNALDVVLVALGIPAGAAVAAALALRRVRISPLGVMRRVTPRPPRAYRLIPLCAGIAEMLYFVDRRPHTTNGQVAAYLGGIATIMVGLVVAGPWLTKVGARLLAGRSGRPAVLIAARRLADNPKAGFRAISGLVLALFVTSVAVGVITTVTDRRGNHTTGAASGTAMTAYFWPDSDRKTAFTTVSDRVVSGLRATPGVRNVLVVRYDEAGAKARDGLPGLVSCADLARSPDLGRCAPGASVASVWADLSDHGPNNDVRGVPVWAASPVAAGELRHRLVFSIVVDTDGSTAARERTRTTLELDYPLLRFPPSTTDDRGLNTVQTLAGWQRLATVVILATLPIAGCSLAVSVAGGLAERKRPFSLLRLTGVPLRMLRRVVALESAAPLLVAAAVAVGAGLLAADLFLRSQMSYTLDLPGVAYYLTVLGGLAMSLMIIGSTLPILARITGPETARNE